MTTYAKKFYRVDEVSQMFSFSRSYVYDLIHKGKLDAWHPDKAIGSRGLRITAESVHRLESAGHISPDKYYE